MIKIDPFKLEMLIKEMESTALEYAEVLDTKKANLNVSANNFEHAKYFRDTKRPGGEIIEFEVPKWFDDFIKENRIPQDGYLKNIENQGGTAPKIVDPTTPGTSYELPKPWVHWIEEYGSNRKVIK
ncbi:hypothetical protein DCC39_15270 [Pueribacillus theae]|uniref:Uncharacterized protein n=1 Tax=Pueribacillus theae TaxID=2171751 RepID=A0A2U1JT14_9BACI|nr:hypothetical protein [Pueribacillus theae]PWA08145.1 hypothetical protein DCC39_15270 [Pueribacillus theae]